MRRRRRNRRLFFLVFLITGTIGAGLYMNRFHDDEVKSNLTNALGSEQRAEEVIDAVEAYLPDSITG